MGLVSDLEQIRNQKSCEHDFNLYSSRTTSGEIAVVEYCHKCGLVRTD